MAGFGLDTVEVLPLLGEDSGPEFIQRRLSELGNRLKLDDQLAGHALFLSLIQFSFSLHILRRCTWCGRRSTMSLPLPEIEMRPIGGSGEYLC